MSRRSTADGWVLLVAVLFLAYCVARAASLSITHDEALTYLLHVTSSVKQTVRFEQGVYSNNHLLHTLAAKLSVGLFGNHELALRLPSLMGLVLYMGGVFGILRRVLAGWRLVLGFVLMLSNPFLADFFSCSRGYSLAVGFFTLGLWALFRRVTEEDSTRQAHWAVVALASLCLAVLANLSLAIAFVAVLGMVAALELQAWRTAGRKPVSLAVAAVLTCGLLCLVYNPGVLERIQGPIRNWGGESGVWRDSVLSLIRTGLYRRPYADVALYVLPWLVAAVAIWALLRACLALRTRRRADPERLLLLIVALTTLIVVGIQSQVMIFELPFPKERAVLFLYPLFGLALAVLALRVPAFWLLAGALALHGLFSLNLRHYYSWRYDADTKAAMQAVERASRSIADTGEPLRLFVHPLLEPSTNYYIVRNQLERFAPTERHKELLPDYDFYYLLNRRRIKRHGLDPIVLFAGSGAFVALPGTR